jgi:hypothetical protein
MLKAREVWEEQEARREQRMAAMRPVIATTHAKKYETSSTHDPEGPLCCI